MQVQSKGNVVEIAPGLQFVEQNHSYGAIYILETISEVEVTEREFYGRLCKQYVWNAKNINNGSVIQYCITEGYESYGPTLFQTPEDAKDFWNMWSFPATHQD